MKGAVAWFTGLPSSGKTTLARAVAEKLKIQGAPCLVLDSDDLRSVMRPAPGYGEKDRDDFYATVGGLAVLMARQGLIALVAATAPRARHRDYGRVEGIPFVEIFVDVPVAECERRDAKGLYRKARVGEIENFPGVSAEYEAPAAPDAVVRGGMSDESVAAVCSAIAAVRGE